jgi:hypothetical protein
LSPSIWPQIAWCKRQVCPCYTTLPAIPDCPAYIYAQWQMYWGPHSLLHRWQHPYDYSLQVQEQRILGSASADTQPDSGNSSRLYEVNLWLWRYGLGQPRTMSIDEAEAARQDRISEARRTSGTLPSFDIEAKYPISIYGRYRIPNLRYRRSVI